MAPAGRNGGPLRVALATQDFGFRASLARDAAILSRELASRGVDVHCYCDPATRTDAVDGVTFHDVRPLVRDRRRLGYALDYGSFAVAAARALARDRERYDIVQVNEGAGWVHDVLRVQAVRRAEQERWPERGGRGYRFAGLRARVGPVVRPQIGIARAIERLQFRPGRFRAVVAVTDEVADDVARIHGVARADVDVVPCAVDLARFADAHPDGLRGRLGVGADALLLLFVGHDFERKGLASAIRALGHVGDGAHLVVVGAGDTAPYRDEAEAAAVAGRVHFVGETSTPEQVFAASDVFVLPTREDVWGMTILEAMAAGIPVVTTEVAGAATVVRRADAGVVVRDGRPEELARAVARLIRDPDRRRQMGRRGRAAAAAFSASAYGDAMLAIYDRILGRR